MQASGHYAQGIVDELVDKESVGTVTPNRHTVLNRKLDQGKGGYADYCGIQLIALKAQREMLTSCAVTLSAGET